MATINRILLQLCQLVYPIIPKIYSLIEALAEKDLFDSDQGAAIRDRIWTNLYIVLSIVVLFAIAVKLINAIVNPDVLTEKQKGAKTVYFKSVAAVFLIVLLPMLFSLLRVVQNDMFTNRIVTKIILGQDNINSDSGQILAIETARSFFEMQDGQTNPFDGATDVAAPLQALYDNQAYKAEDDQNYVKNFNPLVMLISGGFVVYQLVTIVMDVAVRTIKLRILELMVPAIIGGFLFKTEILKAWFKEYIKTFLQVFLLLISVSLIAILLGLLQSVTMDPTAGFIMKAFIIFGILTMAKQAMPLINSIFGTNIKSKGGIKGRLGEMAAIGGLAQQAWSALGNKAKGIAGAAVGLGLGAAGVGARKFGEFMTKKRSAEGLKEAVKKAKGGLKNARDGFKHAKDLSKRVGVAKTALAYGRKAKRNANRRFSDFEEKFQGKVSKAGKAIGRSLKYAKDHKGEVALKMSSIPIKGLSAAIKAGVPIASTLLQGANAGKFGAAIKAGKENAYNQIGNLKVSEQINKRKGHEYSSTVGQDDNGKVTDAQKIKSFNSYKSERRDNSSAQKVTDMSKETEHIKTEGTKRLLKAEMTSGEEALLKKAEKLTETGRSSIESMASALKYSSNPEEVRIGQVLEGIGNKYKSGNDGNLSKMLDDVKGAFIGSDGKGLMTEARFKEMGLDTYLKNISTNQDGINDIGIELKLSFDKNLATTRASLGTSISVAEGNTNVAKQELEDYKKLSSTTDVEREEIEMQQSRATKQFAQVTAYSEMDRYTKDGTHDIGTYADDKKVATEFGRDLYGSTDYYPPFAKAPTPGENSGNAGGNNGGSSGGESNSSQGQGSSDSGDTQQNNQGNTSGASGSNQSNNQGPVVAKVDLSELSDTFKQINKTITDSASNVAGEVKTQGETISRQLDGQDLSEIKKDLRKMRTTLDSSSKEQDNPSENKDDQN